MSDFITKDISDFTPDSDLLRGQRLFLTVKSLDQIERRRRLIDAKQRGRLGRIEPRPIATGLLIGIKLELDRAINKENAFFVQEFREPRGLTFPERNLLLVAEINRVLLFDVARNSIRREYQHPFFAFLHSLAFNRRTGRFLVVSSGYDCLIEMDLETGVVCWEWFAWEHGFNPNYEGVYLARTTDHYSSLQASGREVKHIDPKEYGEHGLMTSQRSNHPNAACYHPYDPEKVLATLGHSGEVVEIHQPTGEWRVVVSGLQAMPHAIRPYQEGWMVTNTLAGECWLLNDHFQLKGKLVTAHLSSKPPEMGPHEWLQVVHPLEGEQFIGADANRGLIIFDLGTERYSIASTDEHWCVHEVVSFP